MIEVEPGKLHETLLELVGHEGPYHLYEQTGKNVLAHATLYGANGYETHCPACMLLQLAKEKDDRT